MNASDYLQRSTLYRKLIHGRYGEFSRVYAAGLSDEGLGRQCTWRSLSLFRDLMDWHVGNGHDPQHLSEVHVDRFLEHRFKHWSAESGDRSALRRLLAALREEGLIPGAAPLERTEHEQVVDESIHPVELPVSDQTTLKPMWQVELSRVLPERASIR